MGKNKIDLNCKQEHHMALTMEYYVDIQEFSDDTLFWMWWNNFLEINERLHMELSINKRQWYVAYIMRFFFVALWAFFREGLPYISRQKSSSNRFNYIEQTLIKILELCSENDYFMIQYYRNSASHIFLTKYSALDKNRVPKNIDSTSKFYSKKGEEVYLTYGQILQKVEDVFNGKVYTLEYKYKQKLINKLYPIIHDYYIELKTTQQQQ